MNEYFICEDNGLGRLIVQVNDKLSQGFLLAGNLVIECSDQGSSIWYYQPMIKYTPPTFPSTIPTPEPEDVEPDEADIL